MHLRDSVPPLLALLIVAVPALAEDAANLVALDDPAGPATTGRFAASVAVAHKTVLVGAPMTGEMNAGAAYRFDGSSGALVRTLENPAPSQNDLFSLSVALTGTHALVGAYGNHVEDPFAFVGAAYLYDVRTGALQQRLAPVDPEPGRSSAGPWHCPIRTP